MSDIYALINDKEKGHPFKTFYGKDEVKFKEENKKGWGVFFAVNKFDITDEAFEAFKLNAKSPPATKRNDEFCTKLRFVYSDLDIAKNGDGTSRQKREELKNIVSYHLIEKCEPSYIIDTSNGIQPLWTLEDIEVNDENKLRYKKVIKGIIEWSKQYDCKADGVFDTARVLRLTGYYHQKEEPFMVKKVYESKKKYKLEDLEKIFPYEEKQAPIYIPKESETSSNPYFNAIQQIDFPELIIKAFASVGRPVSFDKSGRLEDPVGGTTGTFIGRKGDRDYLCSSSHEPFKGNRVTAVADILKIDYSLAYQWIIKEYNLDYKKLAKQEVVKKQIEKIETPKQKIDEEIRFTWGTDELNDNLALIEEGNFIVAAAKSGSGKTTFVFDMAYKNAMMGHKVMFISLEMDEEKIKDDFGRKHAGIQVKEQYRKTIPDYKQQARKNKIQDIECNKNLIIKGIRRSGDTQWETIEEIIKQSEGVKMVFIDNLDLISGKDKESDLDRQQRIIKHILSFTSETKVIIVLIHHYRKSMSGKDMGLDDMSGSAKIRNGADRIIKITKNSDINAVYPEKFRSQIYLQKGRGYPEVAKDVYFIRGTFVDIPPSEENYYKFETLNQIAADFGGEIIPM